MRFFLPIFFLLFSHISFAQITAKNMDLPDVDTLTGTNISRADQPLISRILSEKGTFFIKNLDFNSEEEDFGTSYYKDKIVFASSGNRADMIKRKWSRNDLSFLDLVVAEVNEESEFVNIKPFRKTINKKYNEGPATFNKEGDYMILTRNDYFDETGEGVDQLRLYSSKMINGKWQEPRSLMLNSDDYSTGHASLSADGNTMYLASDMPGGFGGVDIYVSYKENDSVWSTPLNLGNKINTEGNDVFPFIHSSGTLFYSSDGLPGKGGLDIFTADPAEGGFSDPVNLGVPVNSARDDFAFIMNDDMTGGYFSSDRPEGNGNSDIYSYIFKRSKELTLIGYAYNTDYKPLSNVRIQLKDLSGNSTTEHLTNNDGFYKFDIDHEKKYIISGTCKGYSNAENSFSTIGKSGEIYANLFFTKKPSISFICYVNDHTSYEPIKGVTVYFEENGVTEKYVSSETGQITKMITNKGLNDTINYVMTFEKEGYLTKSVNYQNVITNEREHKMHVILDMVRIGMDLGKIINLKPIYFDLNKSDIRPDAALELDKVVRIMNDNPGIVIELGSHTDSRGDSEYNLKLSESRALSSAKYIQERIDDPSRIYGKGYGETQIINRCKDGVPCSDEEHQLNRRTEFKIIKN